MINFKYVARFVNFSKSVNTGLSQQECLRKAWDFRVRIQEFIFFQEWGWYEGSFLKWYIIFGTTSILPIRLAVVIKKGHFGHFLGGGGGVGGKLPVSF